MDQNTVNLLFALLRSAICGDQLGESEKEFLSDDVLQELFMIAKKHDIAHLFATGLDKNGLLKSENEKVRNEIIIAIYRYTQLNYEYERVCDALGNAHIPFIPLKGSVLRKWYPEAWMRTSCDIDILVRETDLDAAIEALVQRGYTCGTREYHDVSLYSPQKIHLELHFSIQEKVDSLDSVLKDAWQYATAVQESRYEFSKEFFLFHIYAHIAYHFLSGGCGLRSLMDIWIMEHKMGITYEMAKELLEKAGIYRFAEEISKLVEVCFSGKEKDDFSDMLLTYIIEGGVYGTQEKRVTAQKLEGGSTIGFAFKRIFWPYRSMAEVYPILKKWPVLLPFCWGQRLFGALFSGKMKRIAGELKTAQNVSADEMDAMQQLHDRLGL